MEIDVFINTSTSQHKVIEKTMQVVQAHLTRFTRNYISTLPPSFQKYMPKLKTREANRIKVKWILCHQVFTIPCMQSSQNLLIFQFSTSSNIYLKSFTSNADEKRNGTASIENNFMIQTVRHV